ncbi:uncharacterized protein SETTUDRAFT_34225 [Exserohilum turcica Et28A]|uniref:MADS-box domain-containing protein n=1 Tax=Exserohilum turcicum (strain 28A) TaxID=671987 RepID=R0JZ10_EXST2|nr:uncharacterized protein SETTUDRAFT_34225 [Exserohilum turcica Et28A]EOA82684.1 hypothetical protein SETTUDRAFT_34225 [Exserohilum turcica Et28A]
MALKKKITKITKDDQTSRRKRTKGLFSKSHELGIRPSCKVFTFVLYTDVGEVRTYDSTGGDILGELETVMERLRRFPQDWQRFGPSSYKNSKTISKPSRCRRQSSIEQRSEASNVPEERALCSEPPSFDFKSLPMYADIELTRNTSGIVQ